MNTPLCTATKEPIFIVGSPRSGTTLLSAMLSSHSNLCCGPETQFFNKINLKKLEHDLSLPDWKNSIYEHLNSLTLSGQSVLELFDITFEDIQLYLKDKKPSIQITLEILCQIYTNKHGKTRWIEKTPNHILHLPEIRGLYPKAKIIRIIRDPRDSAMSMVRLPWTSHSFIENCFLWKKWYKASSKFIKYDQKTIEIKYEDLVKKPQDVLQLLCEFLNEEFQPSMLDTSQSGKMVSSTSEPWKKQVSKPIDTSRVTPWKRELSKNYIFFSSFYFSKILIEHNYEKTSIPIRILPKIITSLFLRKIYSKIQYYKSKID